MVENKITNHNYAVQKQDIFLRFEHIFPKNDNGDAIFSISRALERLHIKTGDLGHKKRHNSKPTASPTLHLLLFFQFFAAGNAAGNAGSGSH